MVKAVPYKNPFGTFYNVYVNDELEMVGASKEEAKEIFENYKDIKIYDVIPKKCVNPYTVYNKKKLDEMSDDELLCLINECEFEVYCIDNNGKKTYKVRDLQGANLGGIEEESFDTILDIADRMADTYFRDYFEDEE